MIKTQPQNKKPQPPSRYGVWALLRHCFRILTPAERLRISALGFVGVCEGILRVLGIASIMPFLAVMLDPTLIDRNRYLSQARDMLGLTERVELLLLLGGIAFALLVAEKILAIFSAWYGARYFCRLEHSLSTRLLRQYLDQPYEFFLRRDRSTLIRNVLTQMDEAIIESLNSAISVGAGVFSATLIIAFLCVIDPLVTGAVIVLMGGAYLITYGAVHSKVEDIGHRLGDLETIKIRQLREMVDGVREVKAFSAESDHFDRYWDTSARVATHYEHVITLDVLPSEVLEGTGFAALIGLATYFSVTAGDSSTALPVLAAFAFAAYRILPAFRDIYSAVINLQNSARVFEEIIRDFEQPAAKESTAPPEAAPSLEKKLEFRSVSYTYPGRENAALKEMSFEIEAHSATCLVGDSGTGKSTTLDLLMGLLTPSSGEILIDGTALRPSNLRDWRARIGYVPQRPYFPELSVAEIIACTGDTKQVDLAKVEEVARQAQIHGFIVDGLPDGYATRIVGNAGQLSGGQQQRLAIARALYRYPEILILDESTTGIDVPTEAAIVDACLAFKRKTTLIFVSHRASVARRCDAVVRLKDGRVDAVGNPDAVLSPTPQHRELLSGG